MQELTDTTVRVLDVAPRDVHVYLWELPYCSVAVAGTEPAAAALNDVGVVLRQGRHAHVRSTYIVALTDVIEACLGVARANVHVILIELPADNIAEGGVPLGPPGCTALAQLAATGSLMPATRRPGAQDPAFRTRAP